MSADVTAIRVAETPARTEVTAWNQVETKALSVSPRSALPEALIV